MTVANLRTPGFPGTTDQEKRIIRVAVLASVLLHVLLVAATWRIPFRPDPEDLLRSDAGREVEIYLEPDVTDPAAEADQPRTYVSVPERQASPTAPEKPDYLALYHSVAADNKLGDTNRPSADEEGDFAQVRIEKEALDGADGVEFSQQPLPEKKPAQTRQQSGTDSADQMAAQGEAQTPTGQWALPEEKTRSGGEDLGTGKDPATEDSPQLEDWWGGPINPSILKAGPQGAAGDRGFDFNQKASGAVTSGVAVVDEFQLNTVQWDWAPWIQVFANELHRHWVSPYAYRLGLINGTTVIRLVVEKDGRPSSMVVLERDGHESLHDASLAALKAFAPYLPLPAHFPEENLVITLSLHYPAFRR